MADTTNWPHLLKELRLKKAFDHRQMSEAIGVSEEEVQKLEAGEGEFTQNLKFKIRLLARQTKPIAVPRDPEVPSKRSKAVRKTTTPADPPVPKPPSPVAMEETILEQAKLVIELVEKIVSDFDTAFLLREFVVPVHWFEEDYVHAHTKTVLNGATNVHPRVAFELLRELEANGAQLVATYVKPPPAPIDPYQYHKPQARRLALILNSIISMAGTHFDRNAWLNVNLGEAIHQIVKKAA